MYVDLSPDEEALVLATLDPIGAMATTDEAKLNELLAEVTVDDAGLLRLLGNLGARKPGFTNPDAIPEVGETEVSTGDLWVSGDHRLLYGDAARQRFGCGLRRLRAPAMPVRWAPPRAWLALWPICRRSGGQAAG